MTTKASLQDGNSYFFTHGMGGDVPKVQALLKECSIYELFHTDAFTLNDNTVSKAPAQVSLSLNGSTLENYKTQIFSAVNTQADKLLHYSTALHDT